MRAAASSIASGSPSRRAADLRDHARSRRRAQPRVDGAGAALEQRDAPARPPAAPSASSCSAASRSGARLVTTSFERGDACEDRAERGRGVEQLLEVVDHDQQLAARRRLADRACSSSAPTSARVVDRGERDEPRALGEPLAEPVRELQREARLADPARAGEREQPHVRVGEQPRRGSRSSLAPEQRRRRRRAAAVPDRRRLRHTGAGARRRVERRVLGEDRAPRGAASSRPGSSPRSSTSAWRARR